MSLQEECFVCWTGRHGWLSTTKGGRIANWLRQRNVNHYDNEKVTIGWQSRNSCRRAVHVTCFGACDLIVAAWCGAVNTSVSQSVSSPSVDQFVSWSVCWTEYDERRISSIALRSTALTVWLPVFSTTCSACAGACVSKHCRTSRCEDVYYDRSQNTVHDDDI